ncbi:MAG: ABC transporter permease subunit [Halapricum sp.]
MYLETIEDQCTRLLPLIRKEYTRLLRSKGTWLLAILLVPWSYRPSYPAFEALGTDITLAYIQGGTRILLPFGVLFLSYRSIVGERRSGSLKFTLGLPLTRREILVGKVVGRTAGIAGALTASFLLISITGLLNHGAFDPVGFVGQLVLTHLYIIILVTIATSISAIANRTLSAAAAAIGGVFLIFELGWNRATLVGYSLFVDGSVNSYSPPESGPLFLLARLSPGGAYRTVSNWLLGIGNSAASYDMVVREMNPSSSTNVLVVETAFSTSSPPWYLYEGFSIVLMLAWIVIPFVLACRQFSRGDLA